MASFKAFNLSERMVSALEKLGYTSPSPVQSRIIPKALNRQSLVCQSETGSGKTHAYLIPIIDRIDTNLPRLQAIIIAPSRELARQVYDFAKPFERFYPHLKVRLMSSEEEKAQNTEGLSIAPQLIIGTPGRLKDLLSNEYELDLHGVKTLVLDEADMLMELGYFDDIDELYGKLPKGVNTMVFSATLHQGLKYKLEKYIASDFLYEGEENKTSSHVTHHLVDIKHVGALEALSTFLKIKNPYLCLVFASKKEDVKKAYDFVKNLGYTATMFSGDLETRERKKTIRLIKDNRYQVIVCSDLLSRGIDIEDVTDVVSLDLPMDLSYYYHRAGRTGRFDKKGDSWVFYNSDSVDRPSELISQGLVFDFLTLKGDQLVPNPLGLEKRKFTKKKAWESEEQLKDIKIAKAKTRVKKVKPGYKVKTRRAIEKVKNKYRRKAIQKAVKAQKDRRYAEAAKRRAAKAEADE